MTKYKIILTLTLIFLFVPFFVGTVAGQPPPPPPTDIPIDGGLSFLLAAGVAYGAKKLYANKEIEE